MLLPVHTFNRENMMYPKGFEHWDMKVGAYKHVCECCNKTFHRKKRTGVKYCSATCRKRASIGHKEWKTTCTCKKCGGYFTTKQPFQHPEYCSNACKQAAYRERKAKKESGV